MVGWLQRSLSSPPPACVSTCLKLSGSGWVLTWVQFVLSLCGPLVANLLLEYDRFLFILRYCMCHRVLTGTSLPVPHLRKSATFVSSACTESANILAPTAQLSRPSAPSARPACAPPCPPPCTCHQGHCCSTSAAHIRAAAALNTCLSSSRCVSAAPSACKLSSTDDGYLRAQ